MEMLTKALQEIKAEDKIVLVSGLRSGQEQAMKDACCTEVSFCLGR